MAVEDVGVWVEIMKHVLGEKGMWTRKEFVNVSKLYQEIRFPSK